MFILNEIYIIYILFYFILSVWNRFEHFVYSAQCSASYSGWLQHFKRGLTAGVTMTRMNGSTRFPLSLLTLQRNYSQANGLGITYVYIISQYILLITQQRGKKTLLSLTLIWHCQLVNKV